MTETWRTEASEEPWTLGDAVTAAKHGQTLDFVEIFVPVFSNKTEELVALVPYDQGSPNDRLLNLIGAAPKLLAAVEMMYEHCEVSGMTSEQDAEVLATLREARGETTSE